MAELVTTKRDHHLVEFRMTSVIVERDASGNVTNVIQDPTVEPSVTYGCAACEAGIDEAFQTPCPGHPPQENT